MLMVYMFKTH